MSRDLIYLVAVESIYRDLARMLVTSARQCGWTGDILAFADSHIDADCETVLLDDSRLKTWLSQGLNAASLRTLPGDLAKIVWNYGRLLYVDTDCLFFDDPRLILDQYRAGVAVLGYSHPIVPVRFTEHDRKRAGFGALPSACSAIVAYPGGAVGEHLLRLWAYESKGNFLSDEDALNLILFREFPDYQYLRRCELHERSKPDTVITHFLGSKPLMRDMFKWSLDVPR